MNILIWGTGKRCEELLEENKVILKKIKISAFIDNDIQKQGKIFHQKEIIPPSKISEYHYDFIYIACTYFDEIYIQLTKELGIPDDKIKKENYLGVLFAQEEKRKHDERIFPPVFPSKVNQSDLSQCKLVVYTAIFGRYDDLKEPEYMDDTIDYVCFTDDKTLTSSVWKVIYVENNLEELDKRRNAKIYKILPHRFFPDYDMSIWIDGTVLIHGNLKKYIKENLLYTNILFCPHPWRNSIYQEAEYAKINRQFEGIKAMNTQMEYYKKQKMPYQSGLIAGGFIVRKHNELDVIESMEDWWKEICEFSTEDQISFAYVAWKNKLLYDVSSEYVYENQYIRIMAHRTDNLLRLPKN